MDTSDALRHAIQSDIELERNQRQHVHDLLFRIIAAYLTISLAAFSGAGYFLANRDDTQPNQIPIAFGLVALGYLSALLHHIFLLNLRVNRDYHRQREGLFRRALICILQRCDIQCALEAYKDALDFSRGDRKFSFDRRRTSLFAAFGALIYVGNASLLLCLGWLLKTSVHSDFISVLTLMIAAFLVHILVCRLYLRQYLSHHKSKRPDAFPVK